MKEAKFPPTTHPWTRTSPKGFFNGLDLVYCAGGGFDFFIFMAIYILADKQADNMFDDQLEMEEGSSTSSLKLHLKKAGSLLCKIFLLNSEQSSTAHGECPRDTA